MFYYLSAAGLVLGSFFWGAGFAWLAMPRRWLRLWPLLALPLGFSLESAVVWSAGWLPLAGTDAYAHAALAIPAGLLAVALWRRPPGRRCSSAVWPALALAFLTALLVVSPWARRGGALTTIANGSCDAADYAAGARVLKEFRPDDRGGFIGQRDVAGILHVDNFFDHWRQLNHFTPAALLALNATLLGRPVHELAGLLGVALVSALVPVTFLVARGVVRLPRRASLGVAALVGLGAIQGYAVYQVALGQLLAAASVAMLTWAGFQLLRERSWARAWPYLAVFAGAWWLLLGSYAFFLVVAFAPLSGAVAWTLGNRERRAGLGRTAVVSGAAIAGAGLFGWERLAGFALRWRLHDTVEYGWPIPRLGPDGWLGFVSSAELQPLSLAASAVLAAALAAAFALGWRRLARRDRRAAWTIAGMVGPAIIGYAILSVKGAVPGSNASYDAYKLLACFQPVLIAAGLAWWRELRGLASIAVPAVAVALVWGSGAPLRARAAARPLWVTPELAEVRRVEEADNVRSVNVLCGEMWPRLWANAFLLRKEQFFAVPTYEGRRPGPLSGEWNLEDSLLWVAPADASAQLVLNPHFRLARAAAGGVRAEFATGWHAEERAGRLRWRWSDGAGQIILHNPSEKPICADLRLQVAAFRPGLLEIGLGDDVMHRELSDSAVHAVEWRGLALPPGRSTLVLRGATPASPGGGDPRILGTALSGFELRMR